MDCTAQGLRDYLRISQAAEFIGVSANTLRNQARTGRVTSYRNPVNGYRLFKRKNLQGLLEKDRRTGGTEDR